MDPPVCTVFVQGVKEEEEYGDADYEGDQETFEVLPHPADEVLVGEVVFMLEVEAGIVIQGEEEHTGDDTYYTYEQQELDVWVGGIAAQQEYKCPTKTGNYEKEDKDKACSRFYNRDCKFKVVVVF